MPIIRRGNRIISTQFLTTSDEVLSDADSIENASGREVDNILSACDRLNVEIEEEVDLPSSERHQVAQRI